MKNFRIATVAMIMTLMSGLLLTCQKESLNPPDQEIEVTFAIGNQEPNGGSMLKSAIDYSLANADKAVITIKTSDGGSTKYTSSEIDILQMSGNFYTEKILLKTGNYKLTEFILVDGNGNTIFAAPVTGSQEAQNVSKPLPIDFTVAKNTSTPVNVEVLSTEKKIPEDFGFVNYPIIEVKTFAFLIGIVDSGTGKLLPAKITVSSGTYNYIQTLDSIFNNVMTVRDGFNSYTLTVEKKGYKNYIHTYSKDSLKLFLNNPGNFPLLIKLERYVIPTNGMIAFYPFNGNANDLSGNNNNGTVNAVTFIDGGKDKVAKFNASSYITIPDNSSFNFSAATGLSFVTWIRQESASGGSILAKMGIGELWDDEYGLFLGDDGLIQGGMVQSSTVFTYYSSKSKLALNTWYNLVVVWNKAAGNISIYINGVLDNTIPTLVTNIQNVPNELRIGKPQPDYFASFIGSADEIRIYNRALTTQEITAIYNY